MRIKAAGLSQRGLMQLTGHSENTISRQMKGLWPVTRHVEAIVIAWEIMTPAQREEWLAILTNQARR